MLFVELIFVHYENHATHKHAGQTEYELFNFKSRGTHILEQG